LGIEVWILQKLADKSLIHRFIDDDPVGTLILQRQMKGSPDAEVWCDVPDDPRFIWAVFEWWTCFHALNDEAADAFVDELPARGIGFAGIRHRWAEKILARREPLWHSHCHLFYWPHDECDAPLKYPVRSLTLDDAPMVNKHWELGGGKAEEYIKEQIQHGIHAACDDESGLVAWAMTHGDGSMGFLYTMPHARHKGYAQTVGAALVKRVLEAGEKPFGYIIVGNDASLEFTLAQGMKTDGYADYLEIAELEEGQY
jgi:GNAT superfamily N-acetyltransferase